jgi:hypothetical protein
MRISSILALLVCGLALAGCADRRPPTATVAPPVKPSVTTVAGDRSEIPTGTSLEVRTLETIKSDSAVDGRTYQAEIAQDVVTSSGRVLIPKGSPARLVMISSKDSGKVMGAQVQFGLQTVQVNGREYTVTSASTKRSAGLGANQQTAQTVGAGAALGAVIGAAAGGGKGAALGGLAGAAAGAAIEIFGRNKEVNIPVETVLSFRLEQALKLEPATP